MPRIKRTLPLIVVWAILGGCGSNDRLAGPCTPAESRQFSAPWDQLSDAQLHAEIIRACGRVFVGFKETGAARGVDPAGRTLTTDETVSRMKRYLAERNVTVEWQSSLLPHVTARMPLSRQLVQDLRHHANIDYLEPIFPGVYLSRQ